MFTSADLATALDQLGRCIDRITFGPTHAPYREGLPDGWEEERRWEVQQCCQRAARLAEGWEDQRAAAEGRVQVLSTPLVEEIGRARRLALSLITLLASRPDLATTVYDRWEGAAHRRGVEELDAVSCRLQAEARELTGTAVPIALPPERAEPAAATVPASPAVGPAAERPTPSEGPGRGTIAFALGVLAANPEWSNRQIAEAAGVHPGSLSNDERFKAARRAIREAGRQSHHRAADGGAVSNEGDD